MAELQMANGEVAEAQQTFEQLLRLAMKSGDALKQREYLWRSAEAFDRLGEFTDAEEQLKVLLEMDLTKEQYLETLCHLADIQVKVEEQRMEQTVHQTIAAQGKNPGNLIRSVTSIRLGVDAERADEQDHEEGLADTLKEIVKRTVPSPVYAKYHEQHLQRFLSKLGAYTPRSALRQDKRAEALKECVKMINAPGGGCCTVFPYEAAIWLLEEQEELVGTNKRSINRSSTASCTNLHRLVSKGSRSNLLVRGPSKVNLLARPSFSGTLSTSRRSLDELPSSNNLQSMQDLQSTGRQHSPSPQQLNWYRGDSIRGVDREFIYKVMREHEEDAAAVRQVQAAVATKEGRALSKAEEFGRRLAHQFPWSPAASVAVGLALRRKYHGHSGAPSLAGHRKQIIKNLKHGIERGANSAAGWKALAELQYQNRQFQEAYDTAVSGLEWSVKRRRSGHETLTNFALALRLVVAQCLRRLERLEEAEYNFQVLAGWTTEGDSAFNELSGSSPLSIRQQALRGIAKVALERGDKQAARHQYERILGKALIGQGPPAAHWAHSEYAWLLFEDGNLELAKQQLETALRSAQRESMLITDSELAEVHYKLGRICWTMGGNQLTDPNQARAHFEAATQHDSEVQALAFQWLGRWYEEIDQDYQQAQHCYERAVALDDDDIIASEALEKLKAQGKITLSPAHSTRLADRIAAKKASAKHQAKNSTAISRIRYEGALERALS
ncbi:Tetratricopeptide repeat protein 37, variant 2 [Trebouxia sp. C0010 RCD-2024]